MNPNIDYYEVLQMSPNATKEVIEASYRCLAKMHHPDLGGDPEIMKQINYVYSILSDTNKRLQYGQLQKATNTRGEESHYYSQNNSEDHNQKGKGHEFDRPIIPKIQPGTRFFAKLIDLNLYALGSLVLFILVFIIPPSVY